MQKNLNQNIVNLQDSIITEFAELAASIDGSLKLTFGQPDFNTPEVIKEAAKKQIDLNRTRYESARGNDLLINNITEYEKNHNNYSYSTDEVVITNGATGAIYIALCTLLNKDDEVIIPCPYYPEYEPVVTRCEAKVINYFNEQFDYQLDYDTLENLITPKTKCLILTSPNNPTGVILNDKSIEVAYKLVKKYNIYLLLDNCYEQLVYDKIANFSKYPDIKDYILICQSFSKPYAMTGWRLGYLLAPKYFIDAAVKLHQYLNVSITSFIQDAGVIALKYYPETELNEYRKRMNYAYDRLISMGLDVVKPNGAFYLFPSIKKYNIDSYTFCKRLLLEEKVALTPGIAFGSDTNIRISFCVSDEVLEESLNRLESFIKRI